MLLLWSLYHKHKRYSVHAVASPLEGSPKYFQDAEYNMQANMKRKRSVVDCQEQNGNENLYDLYQVGGESSVLASARLQTGLHHHSTAPSVTDNSCRGTRLGADMSFICREDRNLPTARTTILFC